jgi:4-aminobutyrate aminotransferase-like enzyme
MACAVGNAVLDRLVDDGVLGRVKPMGDALREALTARFGNHPHVGDIRGRGLFLGLELVADRGTKEAFDPKIGLAGKRSRRRPWPRV